MRQNELDAVRRIEMRAQLIGRVRALVVPQRPLPGLLPARLEHGGLVEEGEPPLSEQQNEAKEVEAEARDRDPVLRHQTPGRTRLINVFLTGPDRWIVDLPGYGYASGPKSEKEGWAEMIEGYLAGRPSLRMVYVLVDAEVGPTKLDLQMFEWLQSADLPFRIVGTKCDKVQPSRNLAQRRDVAKCIGLMPMDIAWVSADKGTGIADLRREVADMLQVM